MSTICVGDLHGKIEVAEEMLQEKEKSIVFMGDFLDSFDRNIHDQLDLLLMVLDAVKNRDEVSSLMGNHELSYLEMQYRCSGYKWQLDHNLTEETKKDMRSNLNLWLETDGFFLSHAGISRRWVPPKWQDDVPGYLAKATTDEQYQIGASRGGYHDVGGLLWCDYHADFRPIRSIKQVFGHTAMKLADESTGIRTDDDRNYCIDCLDRVNEVLEIDNGEAKTLTF